MNYIPQMFPSPYTEYVHMMDLDKGICKCFSVLICKPGEDAIVRELPHTTNQEERR